MTPTCPKATAMTIEERCRVLGEKKCCFVCLIPGHFRLKCKAKVKCTDCGRRHYKLVCRQGTSSNSDKKSIRNSPAQHDQALTSILQPSKVVLQTLRVFLFGKSEVRSIRALLDSGSQRSYMTTSALKAAGYEPLRKEEIVHTLFGGLQTEVANHQVYRIHVGDVHQQYRCNFEVLDQPIICNDLPPIVTSSIPPEITTAGITLSDMTAGPIELLIGADILAKLLTGGTVASNCGMTAVETKLGWTVLGRSTAKEDTSQGQVTLSMFNRSDKLPTLWELDVLGIKDPAQTVSKAEHVAEVKRRFHETLRRDDEGRYEVRLPWKPDHPELPSYYEVALKRMMAKYSSLSRTGKLHDYENVFQAWLQDGIIEETSGDECCHYLPHRPVFKLESETTKVRPVFDASVKTTGQISLNDCLEVGENFVEFIPSLLLRFRENEIGLSADIRKAFLQISISPSDRRYLGFLWKNALGEIQVLRHARVAFGLRSSPFLLGAVIEDLLENAKSADQEKKNGYPLDVVGKLKKSFYVDNCICSVSSSAEKELVIKVATDIMKGGQFDLRDWTWNDKSSINTTTKVLGMIWDRRNDTLQLSPSGLKVLDLSNVTKRLVLSVAQRIFDPIGFSVPVALKPKVMLQKLWKAHLTWDEPIGEEWTTEFKRWVESLSWLFLVRVPRWIFGTTNDRYSFHVFVDASRLACAAVIFVRLERPSEVVVQLVNAKSRVAPVEKVSIPRLELIAATIGARLYSSTIQALGKENEEVHFWSDSTTVLAWLQREDAWSVFVRNRVKEIKNLTSSYSWRYVKGENNPADLPSRGCDGKQLFEEKWWEGPHWLRQRPEEWPISNEVPEEDLIVAEKRKTALVCVTVLNPDCDTPRFYRRFSSFRQQVRLVGWVKRFVNNCRHPKSRIGELTSIELLEAEESLWRLVQLEVFSGDALSRLHGLRPFTDQNGLVRVRTLICHLEDSQNFRYPLLLPGNHPVVKIMIRELHLDSCHAGTQTLMSKLRERFWIIGARKAVRSIVNTCLRCRRFSARRTEVERADLPSERIEDAVPFEVTGMDLCGPLYLKDGSKVWVVLFTCAVIRAVHLDLVSDLSTEIFVLAFRRFVARRGRPKVIFCDNGSNFVGAYNDLSTVDWEDVSRRSDCQRIKWRFIPPTAAWWGGFWERLVGLLKQLLWRTLGRACLDSEELYTLVCECEAILNSRPLTYVSEDINDLTPLTPLTFLREPSVEGTPDFDNVDASSIRRRQRYRQRLRDELRQRFRIEYLGSLTSARSDPKYSKKLRLGELVLVGHDNHKRMDWPLARVIELLPGNDGHVRAVKSRPLKENYCDLYSGSIDLNWTCQRIPTISRLNWAWLETMS